MADEPWYSPFAKPQPPKALTPRIEIWRLHKHTRVIACVIRDNTDVDAGWDVMLLDGNGELGLSKHCGDEAKARRLAETWRQDYARVGYVV